MTGIATEFLFAIALDVPVLVLGGTPHGMRRIARFIATGSRVGDRRGFEVYQVLQLLPHRPNARRKWTSRVRRPPLPEAGRLADHGV